MRYCRVILTATGVLIVAAFLLCWVTSYLTFVRVSLPLKPDALVCISYQGQLTAVVVRTSIPEVWWERGDVHVAGNTYPDQLWPRKNVLGFGWITDTMYLNVPNSPVPRDQQRTGLSGRSWTCPATGLMLPDSFVALMLASLPVLPWVKPRFSLFTLLAMITLIATLLGIFKMASRASMENWQLNQLQQEVVRPSNSSWRQLSLPRKDQGGGMRTTQRVPLAELVSSPSN